MVASETQVCERCGATSPATSRQCGACAAPLGGASERATGPANGGPVNGGAPSFTERLRAWAEQAAAERRAAEQAAAAYVAQVGHGPAAAEREFARLDVVATVRTAEAAARRVFGDPPPCWHRYYPSPATPVQGAHETDVMLAAGSTERLPGDAVDPMLVREALIPRLTLRVRFTYASGQLEVGRVSHLASQWTKESFEAALLDQLERAAKAEELAAV